MTATQAIETALQKKKIPTELTVLPLGAVCMRDTRGQQERRDNKWDQKLAALHICHYVYMKPRRFSSRRGIAGIFSL